MIAKTQEEKDALKKAKALYKKEYGSVKVTSRKMTLTKELKDFKEPIFTGLFETETELEDNYNVFGNYLYVAKRNDTYNVVMCDVLKGTVKDLKKHLSKQYGGNIISIHKCDLSKRNLL